jgi:hypothetical protein
MQLTTKTKRTIKQKYTAVNEQEQASQYLLVGCGEAISESNLPPLPDNYVGW